MAVSKYKGVNDDGSMIVNDNHYNKICEVMAQRIEDGIAGEACDCPIALALNDCENEGDLIYEASINPSDIEYVMRHWVNDSETGRNVESEYELDIHPDDLEAVESFVDEFDEGGDPTIFSFRYTTK